MRVLAVALVLVGACSFGGKTPEGQPGEPDAPAGTVDAPPAIVPDAPVNYPVDAQPSVACPEIYDVSYGASRYWFSSGKATWEEAEVKCESDSGSNGWTHLIVLDDNDEWSAASFAMWTRHGDEWQHIGILRDAGDDDAPWRSVVGGPPPVVHWRQQFIGGTDEPNNGGGDEGDEPAVVMDPGFDLNNSPSSGGFLDMTEAHQAFYACECDGRAAVDARFD
jgi:hypothetical protein